MKHKVSERRMNKLLKGFKLNSNLKRLKEERVGYDN